MKGISWLWGQADRGRGAGFGFAHLFPRDAATDGAIDAGWQARCGYDPTRHNGVALDGVLFRAAIDDAPRCRRCEPSSYVVGHTYYPIGEHPADVQETQV